MDPDLPNRPSCPSIWSKRCHLVRPTTGERQQGWGFSKSRNFDRRGKAINSSRPIHSTNCIRKPPSLLRLSSTGDTVDETADFSSFQPSTLRRSKSSFRGPGFWGNIAKVARSTNVSSSRLLTAKGFTRESPVEMAGEVDLSILMEKFDSSPSKMERLGPLENDIDSVPVVAYPLEGGLRGFVKEGIYHPFARNPSHQVKMPRQANPAVVETRSSSVHTFPVCNGGPFWHPHGRQHPHPYFSRNHFTPNQRRNFTMASVQFWQGPSSHIAAVSSLDTPILQCESHRRRCLSAQIRESAVLRNWIADPSTRSQFINTETIAARLVQSHDADKFQSQHTCTGHHAGRNSMMQSACRTQMTQHSQNRNKATGCVYTGNAHQAHRRPLTTTSTGITPKQSCYSPKKSVKQPVSKCFSRDKLKHPDGKTAKLSDQQAEKPHKVYKPETPVGVLDHVTDEVKDLKIQAKSDQGGGIPESRDKTCLNDGHACTCGLQSQTCVTSSVDCKHHEMSPYTTAGRVPPDLTGPKSADNETSPFRDTCHGLMARSLSGGKSHLLEPDEGCVAFLDELPALEKTCLTSEDDYLDEGETRQNHQNAVSGLSPSSPATKSPPELPQTCGSQPSEPEDELSQNRKPLHSSLAFLLAGVTDGDNDFSDSDWDSAGSSPPSDSWDFLKCCDDPYNPLYGWRCARRCEQGDVEQGAESKLDSPSGGDDERDSGISSLQAHQDDVAEISPAESESWDEAEPSFESESTSWCQQIESLHAKSECPNSSNDSNHSSVPDSLQSSNENHAASDLSVQHCEVQSKVQDNPTTSLSCLSKTDGPQSISPDEVKSGKILPPRKCIFEPEKLHPSVLFILGVGESDSDTDCEDDDDDDFDNCESGSDDSAWSSLQPCFDPYSPLQGWRFHLTTPEKLQEVNAAYNKLAPVKETSSANLSTSEDDRGNSCSGQTLNQFSAKNDARPKLKRASSTGCLWVPCDGSGPGRPSQNKKVHFCEEAPMVISFEVPSWSSEYSDSRRGPWQEMARDRCRFMDRIRSTEDKIGHVFAPDHRLKVQQRLQTQVA
ncbi:uncharacterized protein LOC110978466 [Acanthaster planci]|uniref:Protein DP71L n=1 Tax=Acanthaster planci TaxID=133434 RepID=A0A8B7Y7I4_ACAPL|nr:uncharacterized protein LOC110978466 [Acanthaster planci]